MENSLAMALMRPTSDSQPPARQTVDYPYPWLSKGLILVIATAFLGSGLIPYFFQRHLVMQSGESLQLTAHAISSNLGQVLFDRYGDIQIFAATIGGKPIQPANITDALTKFKEVYPLYSALSFADRHGRVVAATDSSEVGVDVSRTAWFRDTATTGIIQAADYDASERETTRFAVTFSAPVRSRNGELLGVVHTGITGKSLEEVVLSSLYEISKELSLFKAVEYQVLSGAGVAFIDSTSRGEDNLLALGVLSAWLAESHKKGWVEEIHLRRAVPIITGYATLAGNPDFIGLSWRVLIRVDRQDAMGAIRNTLKTVGAIQAAVFLPLCVALCYAIRKIKREWSRAREAENRSWSSERRIRQTIETALDAVIVIDGAGFVVEWNSQAVEIFGWERQEALGQCLGDMIVPEKFKAMHAAGLRRVCETGNTTILGKRLELPALHRDGHELLVEIAITEGHLFEEHFFTAFIRDITIATQSARRLAAQYEVTKVLASAKASATVFPEIIKSICEGLDWDLGELWLVDGPKSVLCPAQVWHRLESQGDSLLADTAGKSFSRGIGLPGRVWEAGTPVWVSDIGRDNNLPRKQDLERAGLKSAFAFPLRIANGEILGVLEFFSRSFREPDLDLLNMLESIGSQIGLFLLNRRADELLRKSEMLFVNVVDCAHDAIIAIDKSQRVMLYNQGAVRIFGYESADVVGRPFDILLPEQLRKSHRGLVEHFFEVHGLGQRSMGKGREIKGRRKNGEEFFAEASIGLIEIFGERVAAVVLRDITERRAFEEMQRRYQETLKKDIAERTVELERARATAESANRTKSDFLANMSHELRTPMHAILSFANLGIEKLDKEMPEKVSRYLHRIRESGTRLLALLNGLLDLSKLNAGKMIYELAPQDLLILVRTSVEQLDPLLQQKALTLTVREEVRPATVPCDAARITQVLQNLLSNSIKFTPEGRTITITIALAHPIPAGSSLASEAGPAFTVTVSDEGIGIPEADLERVFDQFAQSHRFKTGAGGTGLGLAISREIVRAHGGDIQARNNPGGGVSVTFTLPQEAATLVTQET